MKIGNKCRVIKDTAALTLKNVFPKESSVQCDLLKCIKINRIYERRKFLNRNGRFFPYYNCV